LNKAQKATGALVQRQINKSNLKTASFFDEVYLKIHRSHLLQAFLFDHIQPEMPAFNHNLFKVGSVSDHINQYLWASNEQSMKVVDEMTKIE